MSEIAVYTTSQVADRFYVDSSTVRLWVKDGKIEPLTRTAGGHYRFSRKVIDSMIAAAQTTPSPALPSRSPHPGEGVSASEAA